MKSLSDLYFYLNQMPKLTSEQFNKLAETFTTEVVDNMSREQLESYVYNAMIETFRYVDEEVLISELDNYFEEEVVNEMLQNVGANPADFV